MSLTTDAQVQLVFPLTVASLIVLAILSIIPYIIRKDIVDNKGHPIPPGPLFRYAFLRKYPELTLDAWAKKFGPLFSVWMGNQLFMVISDPHIARDLLVNNGAIFSSRKQYFMKNQTILHGRAITASQYGDTWRQHRKIARSLLTPKAVEGYASQIDYESHILLRSLYNESKQGTLPINPAHYAGRYALNIMLIVSFGTRTDSTSDPLVERALALAFEFMELTGPWSNAIDFIEPLQWIPTPMRSRGRKLHDSLVEVYGAMILRVKARMDSGENVPDCLVKTLIQTQEEERLDWEDICMLTAVFTLGGVHSVSVLVQWLLALLPSHPDVQARAHEELDRVVGKKNWPTVEDEERLPYCRAIIKEIQRVHAPFWMATPHCSSEDFVYNGMFIPKGTVCVLNCYTLHHDERRYPDPHTFNPDRYLGDNLSCASSAKLGDVMQRDHWTFGAGRRICPAVAVAERELWLAISRLLWSYTTYSLPEEPICLDEYDGSSGRTPLPFRVKLVPRHDRVHSVMEEEEEITL
jgi:cytochrome P450